MQAGDVKLLKDMWYTVWCGKDMSDMDIGACSCSSNDGDGATSLNYLEVEMHCVSLDKHEEPPIHMCRWGVF